MTKTFIAVRDVDEETFRKFRAMSVEERMKLGEALNLAMRKALEEEKLMKEKKNKPDPRNLLRIKPIKIGNKRVRWSEEIDEILYGFKK